MKIQDIYRYAWFSDLSYVKWDDLNTTDAVKRIKAANAAARIPGDPDHPGVDNLGDLIFEKTSRGGLGWKILDFQPNDAARCAQRWATRHGRSPRLGVFPADLQLPAMKWIGSVALADQASHTPQGLRHAMVH